MIIDDEIQNGLKITRLFQHVRFVAFNSNPADGGPPYIAFVISLENFDEDAYKRFYRWLRVMSRLEVTKYTDRLTIHFFSDSEEGTVLTPCLDYDEQEWSDFQKITPPNKPIHLFFAQSIADGISPLSDLTSPWVVLRFDSIKTVINQGPSECSSK